jgi:uncharacterized protein YhfF
MDWRELESFRFGDNAALADALAALALEGRKTATCWPVADGQTTYVGKRMVLLDGADQPRAVVETVELFQRRYDEVDEAFAYDEGEDDRTLASWREQHRRYFMRLGNFSERMLLWCERFRIVFVIDGAQSGQRS